MAWTAFFKNPKTALAGSSFAILGGVIGAISASPDPVSTTLVITSALSALGGLGGNFFSSACEKSFLNKSSRDEILKNGDLTRAVGRAIFLLILEESKKEFYGDDRERLEIIGNSDESIWEDIVLGIEDKENPRFVLSEEDLSELSSDFLTHYVAAETGKIDEIESLTPQEWRIIVEKLGEKHGLILQLNTSWNVAKQLHKNFAKSLRKTLITDFAEDGKAFASLQLRISGEILFYVKENYKTNQEILEKVNELVERTNQIEALYSSKLFDFDDKFWKDAFDLQKELKDIAFETLTRVRNIDENLEEVKQDVKKLLEDSANQVKSPDIPKKLPISRFPSRVNFFTGRKTILENIEKSLRDHKTASLYGTHGLGKSSIATEFAYLNEDNYSHVLFIRAFGAEFDLYIGEIVENLHFETDEKTTPDQKLGMLQHWLATNKNWLLILDNVDDVSKIKACNFTSLGGLVLFTSNDKMIYEIGNKVDVPNMETEEAASLLYQHWKSEKIEKFEDIPEDKRGSAKQIAEKFGYSPLAMTFVGVYLAKEDESLTEFLETYQDKKKNLLANYKFLSNYQHQEVAAPFLLAFEAITKPKGDTEREMFLAEAVKDYLKICAYLSPNDMPEEFFQKCVEMLHAGKAESLADKDFFKEVRKRLSASSIFERDSDKKTFTTHRLVQEIMSFEIKDEEDRLLEMIAETLNENAPLFDYTNRQKVEPYLAHLQSFIEYLEKSKTEPDAVAKSDNLTTIVLSDKIGRYYDLFGQYETAKKYYLLCREICEKIYGDSHTDTAGSYNNLGNVYYSQGDYPKAEENHLKSLKIRLNVFGENHPDTATSYNNLGAVYENQEKLDEAEKKYKQALIIYAKFLPENHPEIQRTKRNLERLRGKR
ncbi:MAG TPA: tetratricopeptide repeat protein [Pyrinomonadaceae bacterium]|nr:tetratricopeptide repeat protein [Pyrinomonadaceae bacterium]